MGRVVELGHLAARDWNGAYGGQSPHPLAKNARRVGHPFFMLTGKGQTGDMVLTIAERVGPRIATRSEDCVQSQR